MATGSRTLKLSILADVNDLTKNLKTASKDTNNFTDDLVNFGKKAAIAFTAATVAAGAFAAAAVKNAAADAAAQRKLEETIRASTSATEAQIKATSEYIDKTSLAVGVTDDQLRPSLARLIRSTNDTENAQKLLNLALDISVATGKPLEAVSNALGKAYDGNSNALGKLGLGLDANILKSKDTDLIFQQLTSTFGNFAENEATSVEAKFRILNIALDESKEAIGAALLPIVDKFATFLVEYGIPVLETFIMGLTGKGGLSDAATDAQKKAYAFGNQILSLVKIIFAMKEELLVLGAVIAAVFVGSKIVAFVTAAATAIRVLIGVYNALKVSAFAAGVATLFAANPILGVAGGVAAFAAFGLLIKKLSDTDVGIPDMPALPAAASAPFKFTSPVSGNTLNLPANDFAAATPGSSLLNKTGTAQAKYGSLGEALANLEYQQTAAQTEIARANLATAVASQMFAQGASRETVGNTLVNNYFTVQGAIDPEGTARTIVDILNKAEARGTLGAGSLVSK